MAAFKKNNNGEDAIYVSNTNYVEGSLQSTNIVAVVEISPGQKDYTVEDFFSTTNLFKGLSANHLFDNKVTGVGFCSRFMIVYITTHLPFYKMLISRWSITVPINDYCRFAKMYAMAGTLAQLGVKFFACIQCLDFFKPSFTRHYHSRTGNACQANEPMTKDLQFVGEYATAEFIDTFNIRHALVHGTNSMEIVGQRHAVNLENYHASGKYADFELRRLGCSFMTLSGIKEFYVGPGRKVALRTDFNRRIAVQQNYSIFINEANMHLVDSFYKLSAERYGPFYKHQINM